MSQQSDKVYKPGILPSMVSIGFTGLFILVYFYARVEFQNLPLVAIPAFIILAMISFTYFNLSVQRYEMHADGIYIKSGIIAKSRGTVLYSQIQDVREFQGGLARLFGVISLEIKTMSLNSGVMQNLSKNDAEEIKDFIASKISKKSNLSGAAQKISGYSGGLKKEMPYPIHPFRKLWLYLAFIALLIILVIILGAAPLFQIKFGISLLILSGILGILMILVWLMSLGFVILLLNAAVARFALSYSLNDDFLEKRYDFISKSGIRIPYDKIQDLVLKRGVFDRMAKLSNLIIETGEKLLPKNQQQQKQAQQFLNSIPYLSADDAMQLHSKILKQMSVKKAEAKEIRSAFPLDKIKILKKSLRASYYAALFLGIILAIVMPLMNYFSSSLPLPLNAPATPSNLLAAAIFIVLLVFIIDFIFEFFYFKTYYYADSEDLLILRKGVFTITNLTIPYSKIQHIFIDRDLFDRMFGLWDVHVASAGTTAMELHIDGLKKEAAEGLRNLLIKRTGYRK